MRSIRPFGLIFLASSLGILLLPRLLPNSPITGPAILVLVIVGVLSILYLMRNDRTHRHK